MEHRGNKSDEWFSRRHQGHTNVGGLHSTIRFAARRSKDLCCLAKQDLSIKFLPEWRLQRSCLQDCKMERLGPRDKYPPPTYSLAPWNSQYMYESRCFFPSYARMEFHFMLEGRLKLGGFLAGYFHFMPEPILQELTIQNATFPVFRVMGSMLDQSPSQTRF